MTISIIGLGYVGLPLALALSQHFQIIGYDIQEKQIANLQHYKSDSLHLTSNSEDIQNSNIFIVTVPTPINKYDVPDLKSIKEASKTIAKYLKKGDLVIYESTMFPGATEEICVPLLEKYSKGLRHLHDFNVAYSPERIVPGDQVHTLESIVKIVSGDTEEILEKCAEIYSKIIKAGVYKAPSIKVAEASKIVENIQRDVNIALMNELSVLFKAQEIDTHEVLKAASTKFNFIKFTPGLVGGHCISVDPYYLKYKAHSHNYTLDLISTSRRINNGYSQFLAMQIAQNTLKLPKKQVSEAREKILILGLSFKEDVSDFRNSKVFDLIDYLNDFGFSVDLADPIVDSKAVLAETGFTVQQNLEKNSYKCIVLAVPHKEYKEGSWDFIKSLILSDENCLVADIKAVLPEEGKPENITLWRP